MTETKKRAATRMVPAPSHGIIPERDFHERPVLEARNLGIDFGGLHAVEDFNLIIGKTEIAGLIGPNGAGKTTVFNLLTKVYQPTDGHDSAQWPRYCGHEHRAGQQAGYRAYVPEYPPV